MKEFLSDVKELRRRARQRLEQGPVTDGYKADPKKVIAVLNEALATELVCTVQISRRHPFQQRPGNPSAEALRRAENGCAEPGVGRRGAETRR